MRASSPSSSSTTRAASCFEWTDCPSACTLFLGIRNVCISPQANFLFHAPHDDQRRPSEYYLKLFLPHYNAKLRTFLLTNHALEEVDPFFTI